MSIPKQTTFELGASRVGSHFLETYRRCPMLWFNQFLRPHPKLGGRGLERTTTPIPLLKGWLFHEGMAEYYRSGWLDGTYDVEQAVTHANDAAEFRKEEFAKIEDVAAMQIEVAAMLRKYHTFYTDTVKDFPTVRIVAVDGEPLVEKEYELNLGYKDYFFTSRFDAVVTFNGQVAVLEHKTTAASRLWAARRALGMSSQAMGQFTILRHAFPELNVFGVLGNFVVTDRSPKSDLPAFSRDIVTKSPVQMEKFRTDVIRTLVDIDKSVEEYNAMVESGTPVDDAARFVFPYHTNQCVVFGQCGFYNVCYSAGSESTMIGDEYRPKERK